VDHGKLKTMYQEAETMLHDGRFVGMRNRDYYDGAQWTNEEVQALKLRKQAPMVKNRIKRKIDYLVGMEIKTRTDPQVYPRNEVDNDLAKTSVDVVRYIQDDCSMPVTFTAVSNEVFVEGYGGVEVIGHQGKKGVDVIVNHLPYSVIFYDPHSIRPDFEDAKYKGTAKWMDREDAVHLFGHGRDGEAKGQIEAAISNTFLQMGLNSTFQDRPEGMIHWASSDRRRLLIVSIYYKEAGVWNYGIFTGGGVIDSGVSPYLDDEGDPECPIVLACAYIRKRTNDRYGIVSDMIGPQDEINHMISVRQVISEEGAVDDVDKARRQLARPDGWIVKKPNKMLEIQQNNDQLAGQAELLQEAKNEIEQLGPNAGLIGRDKANQSGRAQLVSQQSGMTELAAIYDNLRDFRQRVYVSALNRARQFWDKEKIIRVTDDEGSPRFITVNQSQPVIDPMTGQPVIDPATGQPVIQVKNSMQDLDVDIIVFQGMIELAKVGVQFPPEFYIKASSLRNKKELLDVLKKGSEKPPEQAQAEQDALDIAHETAMADIHKTNALALQATANAKKTSVEANALSLQDQVTASGLEAFIRGEYQDNSPQQQAQMPMPAQQQANPLAMQPAQ
jgi:hypothetical protein